MVVNPIYGGEGPLYDSVQNCSQGTSNDHHDHKSDTNCKPLQLKDLDTMPSHHLPVYDNLHQTSNTTVTSDFLPRQNETYLNSVRYVDQAATLHEYGNALAKHTIANDYVQPVTASGTMPSTKSKSLKKNGQERNKLQLTLSLGGGDNSNASGTDTGVTGEVCLHSVQSQEQQEMAVEETYTVMNPAGSLCNSKSRQIV